MKAFFFLLVQPHRTAEFFWRGGGESEECSDLTLAVVDGG